MSATVSVLPAVVAVVGTLGGVLVSTRSARTERREARAETRRAEALAAVTELSAALADHRRAMWVHEDGRLQGGDQAAVAATRTTTHTTRSAITAPSVAVRVLLPALGPAVDQAVAAVFAMHEAPSLAELERHRLAAKVAADGLVDIAAGLLAARPARRRLRLRRGARDRSAHRFGVSPASQD